MARPVTADTRALLSRGQSSDAIHRRAVELLRACADDRIGTVLDVGCGTGSLRVSLGGFYKRYVGVDVIRHEGFPADADFLRADLDTGKLPLKDGEIDAVLALETIEHVENPRAFLRELARVLKPGGWLIVTTPNQLSLLSKATLLLRNEFNAFGTRDYPAHITALLEVDLLRMAAECGLDRAKVEYTRSGRIVLTGRSFPAILSRAFPRALSDNAILVARKPALI